MMSGRRAWKPGQAKPPTPESAKQESRGLGLAPESAKQESRGLGLASVVLQPPLKPNAKCVQVSSVIPDVAEMPKKGLHLHPFQKTHNLFARPEPPSLHASISLAGSLPRRQKQDSGLEREQGSRG